MEVAESYVFLTGKEGVYWDFLYLVNFVQWGENVRNNNAHRLHGEVTFRCWILFIFVLLRKANRFNICC